MRIIYLHGFASSPNSKKARWFEKHFAELGIAFEIPDLADSGFRNLTISGQLAVIERVAAAQPVYLMGSSMGGFLASLYAARHPEVQSMVLLAPAFGFARRWAESLGAEKLAAWQTTGVLQVMNYATGQMEELGWQLMEDALTYEEEPAITQPCLIYHGVGDDVVPVQASRAFVRTRTCAELREVDDGHELVNSVEEIFTGAKEFFGL